MTRACRCLSLGLAASLVSGCAPESAELRGESVNRLYDTFFAIALVVFCIVVGLIGWSIVRYRETHSTGFEDTPELPKQVHSNIPLEITWFVIPQLIVVGLFAYTFVVNQDVNTPPEENAVVVRVQGFRWGWSFSYEDEGVGLIGESVDPARVVVPAGEDVIFEITARDVNHAFYIPEFLTKRDAIPGHTNRLYLNIEEEGTYMGECAEFCGLLHSGMGFTIKSVTRQEYETWLATQREEG
jgi:cytochrome c oxidase subunit II